MLISKKSHSWEQRKLGDITFQSGEKNACGLQYESYSVSNKDGFINQREQFKYGGLVTIADKSKSIIITPHTFAYNPARIDIGSIGYLNIDRNVLISPMYETFKADNSILNDRFLWHWLKSDIFSLIVKNNQEGGVRTCFNLSKFFNSCIIISREIREQRKIGIFLDELDILITLHQRKQKVNILHKRKFFIHFCYSWEQRKFSELVEIERGGSPRPIDDYITDDPYGLNWVKIGDAPILGNYITKTAEKIRYEGLSKTREVFPGDLILSNSMSFGKPYIMGIKGCIHDGWLLIRNKKNFFDLIYLCHLLGTPYMLSKYKSLAAGSTVNNLNKELVSNTIVCFPNLDEQSKMGQCLEAVDTLITLHQRKCEILKNTKKSLLERMFI